MGFIDDIKVRARQNMKTIVLPETEDRRVLEAAAITLAEGNANIILVGSDEEINKNAEGLDLSKASRIDPKTTDKLQSYIDKLVELRQKKGMTPEKAKEALTTDYTTFAVMMVKMGEADGVVRKSNVAYSSVTDDLTADKGYGGGGKVEDGVLRCYTVKLYVAVAQCKREFGIVVSLERAAKQRYVIQSNSRIPVRTVCVNDSGSPDLTVTNTVRPVARYGKGGVSGEGISSKVDGDLTAADGYGF